MVLIDLTHVNIKLFDTFENFDRWRLLQEIQSNRGIQIVKSSLARYITKDIMHTKRVISTW